jgi:hypothetical protein
MSKKKARVSGLFFELTSMKIRNARHEGINAIIVFYSFY